MKKSYIVILSVLGLFIFVTGITYAFFLVRDNSSSVENSVTTAVIGSVGFEGGPSVQVPVGGIYPGWIGVQEFTVKVPDGMSEGLGAYEIVMDTIVDAAYSDWVSIEVYKTTDMGKTITKVEGMLDSSADNSNEVFVTDSLSVNGFAIPEDSIKSQVINSTSGTISLDKQNFDVSEMVETKYYVVFRFLNLDVNQNGAQGANFNTVIKFNPIGRFDTSSNEYADASGANVPELKSKMVPVNITDEGSVSVADTTKEWYDYLNKEWANAVIVDSSFTTLDPGTTIPMESIEQMYVWVPRYMYDPDSIESAANAIDVIFVSKYATAHPAFTFGNDELTGIWVGKFEQGEDNTIKPNQNSFNNVNLATLYDNINDAMTNYSLDSNVDVHMIKNTEWGAVAYLSQSKYGVCNSDGTCTEKIENNHYFNESTGDIVTGCGGADTGVINNVSGVAICPEAYRWNTSNGVGASTTKNVTGIYDLAGGRIEYVMGNMQTSTGNISLSSSGLLAAPDSKYYDSYIYGAASTEYFRGLPGDATAELYLTGYDEKWNSDGAFFVSLNSEWVLRGGLANFDAGSGVWHLNRNSGVGNILTTSRSVIAFIN